MHSNRVSMTVGYHKIFVEVDRKTVFSVSFGFSTQIMEFEDRQAHKMSETGVLVWKSKNMEPY